MPIRELQRFPPSIQAMDLKKRLIEEWRTPNSANQQPIIIVDPQKRSTSVHIFVIWDDWADMEQLERSEMIMDAYQEVAGIEKSLSVTVAMGLTPKEADRMKIQYK